MSSLTNDGLSESAAVGEQAQGSPAGVVRRSQAEVAKALVRRLVFIRDQGRSAPALQHLGEVRPVDEASASGLPLPRQLAGPLPLLDPFGEPSQCFGAVVDLDRGVIVLGEDVGLRMRELCR